MPQIIYTVPGATSSAFVPVPASTTADLAVHDLVTGQPGTQGIPAAPAELAGQVNGIPVRSGYAGGTGMMPGVWFPQEYYERSLWPNSSGVSVYSDNQLPVPVADPRGRALMLARPPVFLGQSQLKQPKGLPRWANWLPTPNYGG